MRFKATNNSLFPVNLTAERFIHEHTGGEVNLELVIPSRNGKQNRYLHKVFSIVGNELGYTIEEIKDIILLDIGFKETYVNKFTGEVREIRKRTRDLNKSEFSTLTQQVIQWAAEHGISIMTPQEYFET